MSRLDYMSEQELSVQTIADEVEALEKLACMGKTMAPSDVSTLSECVERLSQLLAASRYVEDDAPLPDWLQPMSVTTGPRTPLPNPKPFKAGSR